jgi:ribonuclease HI
MEDIWKLCDLNWSPQSKITLNAAIINLLNTLWLIRNQARFYGKFIPWLSAIPLIIASTALVGNNTSKVSSNSIRDFSFLKFFKIAIHHPRVPVIKEIIWNPPLLNWFKCNIDGASRGNPGLASCGGIFRDHNADFVHAFVENLGITSSAFAELSGALKAIEIAFEKNWLNLWLETDSEIVVAAFKNPNKQIAWPLRNRWRNALWMIGQMNFIVSHIYREGNGVADLIANFGLNYSTSTSWNSAPLFIVDSLESNKLGLPNFRLCLA